MNRRRSAVSEGVGGEFVKSSQLPVVFVPLYLHFNKLLTGLALLHSCSQVKKAQLKDRTLTSQPRQVDWGKQRQKNVLPISGQSSVEVGRFPRRNGFWFLLAFRDLISEHLLAW